MTDQPTVPQTSPYAIDVEPGTYWWCACGRSARQPFCDGSHKGTSFAPVRLDVAEPKKVWFCGCKATLKAPLCDGSHSRL
ncbi:CDGSH iron-sulfur domain-containing protein [Methylotetracoccus oryzae]|uniref:CDGSH iron-sulfur domain-containing protein n=1 Tax=Methylotetracoccus oryzae TaxID=1919059 RepID=UPI00111ACE7F|nr:CDGSH iron-sulfur domain-containing protein [Methylotetracoccus oryzae]